MALITGMVVWFNAKRGFGFLSAPEHQDVFVTILPSWVMASKRSKMEMKSSSKLSLEQRIALRRQM